MKILIIQNGWSGQGISGGDKHLLDILQFWKSRLKPSLMLPCSGIRFLRHNYPEKIHGLDLIGSWELVTQTTLKNLWQIILSYLQRTILSSIQLIISGRFYLVIASSHFLYDVLPLILTKSLKGSKLVVYVYHLVSFQNRSESLRNRLSSSFELLSLKLVRTYADAIFTDNTKTFEELQKRGLKKEKIFLTSVGIRRPDYLRSGQAEFDLCFSGRLVKSKGVNDLVQILKGVKNNVPEVRLVVIGTGDEEAKLIRVQKELQLEGNLILKGFVKEKTKFEVLRCSRVFVLPSYEEGWGISLAEALSLGLPAVVYDLPVLREVFNGGPIFCHLGDIDEMAENIIKLLSDQDYYQQKSWDSRNSVEKYYLDAVAEKEIKILESL